MGVDGAVAQRARGSKGSILLAGAGAAKAAARHRRRGGAARPARAHPSRARRSSRPPPRSRAAGRTGGRCCGPVAAGRERGGRLQSGRERQGPAGSQAGQVGDVADLGEEAESGGRASTVSHAAAEARVQARHPARRLPAAHASTAAGAHQSHVGVQVDQPAWQGGCMGGARAVVGAQWWQGHGAVGGTRGARGAARAAPRPASGLQAGAPSGPGQPAAHLSHSVISHMRSLFQHSRYSARLYSLWSTVERGRAGVL